MVDNIKLLPRGCVLDVAMGSGRNALYLAGMGWEVEGVDISETAIQDALSLAQQKGLTIRAQVGDLEKDYKISPGTYDVIICFNYLQRSLISQIKAGLKRGGMVVYETFIVDQVKFGKPHNPNFLLQYNELLEMFRDFRCLRYREGIIENRKAIASLLAEKVL
jgi:2-polyprenyl-3-methyl-5-hydroxy-6-metoxy-1,4-benzoquinol methylase